MKELMIGNAAGCEVISSYPGTPSTEITESAAEYDEIYCEWAPNEKVALETAFGASLRGVRVACAMKHVGLNVAADPLFPLAYTGVNGGLVVCVADDPGMHSSQNKQDSRHYAIAEKVDKLYVVEELDGIIEAHCRNIGVDAIGKAEIDKPLFVGCGVCEQLCPFDAIQE